MASSGLCWVRAALLPPPADGFQAAAPVLLRSGPGTTRLFWAPASEIVTPNELRLLLAIGGMQGAEIEARLELLGGLGIGH